MKIKTPKREVKSFRNKYLALTIISLLFFATSQAQWIKPNNSYGTISNGQSIERVLFFPTGCGTPNKLNIPDSAVNKFAIYGDSCGNVAYLYNPRTKIWSPISNGSGIIQDGLISGGIVTWSGSGLKFYITPAVYVIGGKFYNSPFDSVTLATAPTSDSRIDLIGVDTTGHAFATTGTASATPIVPQADIGSQIALTTGILLNANDTIPPQVATTVIYDENLGSPYEYVTHTQGQPITINFGNTDNPKQGAKDILISKYVWGSEFYFTGQQYSLTNDAMLTGWVKLNGKFNATLYALCYNSSTKAITNWIPVIFNPLDSTGYQQFSMPLNKFTWAGNTNSQFDVVEFHFSGNPDTSGSKGLYLDNISLQKGINSIPPPTDYSNKLDSVLLSGDTLWQYSKGVKTFKGLASGSGSGNTKYVLEGWGIKIDSPDVNHYIVNIDTTIKSPINVVSPIKAIDSTTIGLDALNLPELRYSQTVRDTSNWKDSTLIDKKYFLDRLASYSPGGTTWGSITGTLSDQTDLQSALDAKQATLVSGTNIKTINGSSLLGSGDLTISGGSGVDSTAVHPSGITTSGDTALVFSDLHGNTSTVSFAFSQYWKKNVNNLYYPTGKVNIGLGNTPAGLLSLVSNPIYSLSIVDDTTGLILKDSANATAGNPTVTPPIVFWFKNYNNGAAASQNGRFKVQAQGTGTATPSGNLYWFFSSNDANYSQVMQLSNAGNLTVTGSLTTSGIISAGNAISAPNLNLSRSYSSVADYQSINMTDVISGLGNLKTYRALWIHPTIPVPLGTYSKAIETSVGDIALNTISGNVIIGKDTADNANKLSVISTESFFGLPSMTSAQRDSVYTTFTGTLAGGSGYNNNTVRIPLSGGSGTGGEAEIVISGGVVTSFRLTKPGKRYKVGDVLSTTNNIGLGTGFSYTITALTPPRAGSSLFNITTGTAQYWNGTAWIDF